MLSTDPADVIVCSVEPDSSLITTVVALAGLRRIRMSLPTRDCLTAGRVMVSVDTDDPSRTTRIVVLPATVMAEDASVGLSD